MVIFLVVTGINEIFTVTPLNWRSDDKQEKQAKKDYFQIVHLLGSNAILRQFNTNSSKVSLSR